MAYDLLKGVRVVEGSAFIAAPLGGLTLAQYGADVIRFDLIGGGIDYGRWPLAPSGRSFYWTGLNRGKRSIAVDIRRPEGREIVQALATAPGEAGGILLANLAAPWLAHAVLAARRPDVITCTIEGNPDGSTAVDYTVNCATGYPMITGDGSPTRPVNHVLPAWDVICATQAAFAVLAALVRRQATGEGAQIRLALSDVAFATLSHLGILAEAELLGSERPSIGNDLYGAFGRDFACADGRRIMVVAISARQWQALVQACGIADEVAALERETSRDFAREAHRYEARDAIADLVDPWIAGRLLAEVQIAFDAAGVCWGLYRSAADLAVNDPRVSLANPIFEQVNTPGLGRHRSAGAAARFDGVKRAPLAPAPLLGEHTDAILADVLGFGAAEIGRLHDSGIVAGPERDPTAQAI